jgi:hypothetical protein
MLLTPSFENGNGFLKAGRAPAECVLRVFDMEARRSARARLFLSPWPGPPPLADRKPGDPGTGADQKPDRDEDAPLRKMDEVGSEIDHDAESGWVPKEAVSYFHEVWRCHVCGRPIGGGSFTPIGRVFFICLKAWSLSSSTWRGWCPAKRKVSPEATRTTLLFMAHGLFPLLPFGRVFGA